jgi:MFS family permease
MESSYYYRYIIVGIAFLVMMIAWGANYSFGVFFTPLLDEFKWTRAMTSGAFSLGIFLEGFGGMFMGRICDRFGPRLVVSICGIMLGMGYMLMSQVSFIWHLYLFYGVVTGIGLSGTYVPIISTISKWFNRRRGLMTGIVSSGMGAGTLLMAPFASWLIAIRGWRFSYMIVGLAALIIIMVSARFLRMPEGVATRMPAIQPGKTLLIQNPPPGGVAEIFKNISFWLVCIVFIFWGMVTFAVLVHIIPFAIDTGFSRTDAINILTIFGASVFFAKIITGIAADRLGSKPVFAMGIGVFTIGLIMILTLNELWVFYLFAVFFAFGYGSGSVIMPNIVAEMFGLRLHGVLLGIVNFCACIGCATGPVAAGWLFDINGNYYAAFITITLLGVMSFIMVLFIKTRRKNNLI